MIDLSKEYGILRGSGYDVDNSVCNYVFSLCSGEGWDLSEQVVELAMATKGIRKRGGQQFLPRPKTRTQSAGQIKRVERARYAKLEDSFRMQCHDLIRSHLVEGTTRDEFLKTFSRSLHEFQVRMYIQGKRTAGDLTNHLSDDEKRFLHGQHSNEMKFMHNFLRDIDSRSGRMRYDQRIDLYALGGYSIYLRGVVSGIPGSSTFRWIWTMNVKAEHCDDCINLHYLSRRQDGFTTQELNETYGYPGERTKCKNRCRCKIEPTNVKVSTTRTRPTSYRHLLQQLARRQNG